MKVANLADCESLTRYNGIKNGYGFSGKIESAIRFAWSFYTQKKRSKIMNFYKYSQLRTDKKKQELYNMIIATNPQYFLTVQFPKYKRREDFELSFELFRTTMAKFQAILLGHNWNKHRQKFTAMAEHNNDIGWHYHVYFYNCSHNIDELQYALNRTEKNKNLTSITFRIRQITDADIENTCQYGVKEIQVSPDGAWESYRYIEIDNLFGPAPKPPAPIQIHTQDSESATNPASASQTAKHAPRRNKIYCVIQTMYYRVHYYTAMMMYYWFVICYQSQSYGKSHIQSI